MKHNKKVETEVQALDAWYRTRRALLLILYGNKQCVNALVRNSYDDFTEEQRSDYLDKVCAMLLMNDESELKRYCRTQNRMVLHCAYWAAKEIRKVLNMNCQYE